MNNLIKSWNKSLLKKRFKLIFKNWWYWSVFRDLIFLFSLFNFFNFTPINRLFKHDPWCLHGVKCLQYTHAYPEEDQGEDKAEESIWRDPLSNTWVVKGQGCLSIGQRHHQCHERCCECSFHSFYQKYLIIINL